MKREIDPSIAELIAAASRFNNRMREEADLYQSMREDAEEFYTKRGFRFVIEPPSPHAGSVRTRRKIRRLETLVADGSGATEGERAAARGHLDRLRRQR